MVRGVLVLVAAALLLPAAAHGYGWPVKPFDRMHPIRGGFDDPRFHLVAGVAVGDFHFGVDIAVPDGTPVYAVEPGLVVTGSDWISLRRPNRREFGYWHVRAAVPSGTHVRLHQLLGYVLPGWGHVHFAESVAGIYRNPLRPGALTPYRERTAPVVDSISVARVEGPALQAVGPDLSGTVALIAGAYDLPPLAPPPPWQFARVTPALVRWRLIGPTGDPTPWRVAVDFRSRLEPASVFSAIYAPGTWQNKGPRQGEYRFWLTHDFDTTALPNGTYSIEVQAVDLDGNVGTNELPITIANP